MTSLGEMATLLPHRKGFGGYASRFIDPAAGFAVGTLQRIAARTKLTLRNRMELPVQVLGCTAGLSARFVAFQLT